MNKLAHRFFDEVEKSELPFVPITRRFLPFLQNILHRIQTPDIMARSAAYFALTGRKGLFLFGDDRTAMILAFHPNCDETVLIFPPFGENRIDLIKKLLASPVLSECEIQLARIPLEDKAFCEELQSLGITVYDDENILDWLFPMHVVSTEKVVERRGKEFNNLRSHINKARRANLRSEAIIPHKHQSALLSVADEWAKTVSKPGFTYDDLIGPTEKALELMRADVLPIKGIIIFDGDNRPVGYWIGDEAQLDKSMAASLVRVSIGRRMGAAEFAGLKVCEHLLDLGIKNFCFGGSENQSLDDFRQKFAPQTSIELSSKNNMQDLSL